MRLLLVACSWAPFIAARVYLQPGGLCIAPESKADLGLLCTPILLRLDRGPETRQGSCTCLLLEPYLVTAPRSGDKTQPSLGQVFLLGFILSPHSGLYLGLQIYLPCQVSEVLIYQSKTLRWHNNFNFFWLLFSCSLSNCK